MALIFISALLVSAGASVILDFGDETVDDLLQKAGAALAKGRTEEAKKLADKAIDLDSKNPQAYSVRGSILAAMAEHAKAVADLDKAIALDLKAAEVYDRRGSEHFKLGHIPESIADFDKFLELKPQEKAGHWRRGISYYYAGRFEEGKKQFEAYEKIDTNDVENAIWHYLCAARVMGAKKARAAMLSIAEDKRVPMKQIYDLFSGKAKPQDVLAAARQGRPGAEELNQRLFYAYLYLGLYYESEDDKQRALEHMRKAAEDHKISGHYMWDVARVHFELRRRKEAAKK